MSAVALPLEEASLARSWVPFGAAVGAHFLLFIWNPVVLTSSSNVAPPPPPMQVTIEDHLPIAPPLPKAAPPAPKPIEKKKKPIPKAHKSGLTLHKEAPLTVTRHPAMAKAAPVRRFVSKLQMPKFTPRDSDEPIAASPVPGISAPAPRPAVQAFAPAPKLHGKSRGVLLSDVPMELSDRGSIAPGVHTVAIPIGEERGDQAALPSAAVMHDAPHGIKTVPGYHFQAGAGSGADDLSGKNRGYHGSIHADAFVEGASDDQIAAASKASEGVGSNGPEIGGPVGDRKVLHRQVPEYPAWAEEKGISALVKIYFTVKSDGTIRANMRILRSSGYEELDSLAKEALAKWRFSATTASSSASEAWGVITFRFTLG